MLSGEPPFTGPTVRGIVARIMSEQPRLLTTVRHNVPPNVALAVSHALEKIPADRFATAHEFAGALRNPAFTASLPSQPRGPFRSRARLTPILYGAGALAGLLLITALWGWMRPTRIRPVLRYGLTFDSAEAIVEGGSYLTRLALSPHWSHLAYFGGPPSRLFIRERSQLHGVAASDGEAKSSACLVRSSPSSAPTLLPPA